MPTTLLPDTTTLRIDTLCGDTSGITMVVTTAGVVARCPDCHQPCARVHSRYCRTVTDLPWLACAVRMRLHTRRFFCSNPGCTRRIFTERLPALVAPYARRTARLAAVLTAVALALGGEAGAQLLTIFGLNVSPDTLLRLLHTAACPSTTTPRVVGIDDWAWRRGHHYGTILCDLEQHCVVDLLQDRAVETVVTWLLAHPGIEVISRDRAGIYAEAATQGAPDAVQVADRWHLLHSLAETLERFLLHKRTILREVADVPPEHKEEQGHESTPVADQEIYRGKHRCSQEGAQRAEKASEERHARLVRLHEDIRRLHAAGADVADIARTLGTSRNTVYRYRDLETPPAPKQPCRRRTLLDPYKDYLLTRWAEGCHNGLQLWREIREQGYAYSAANVGRFVAQLRRGMAAGQPMAIAARRAASAPPSARRVAGLFLHRDETLSDEQKDYLERLREADTEIAAAYTLTQEFATMVRERQGGRLETWLTAARESAITELRSFVRGLEADKAAVQAGLTLEWSNGQVEGHIHRLKLLKRQMYGRAGFDTLRKRVLCAA